MEKNEENQRKTERKLEFEEFNHHVNLLRMENKNQEEIATLEKKNHILSCLLSMASPQLSEAAEKCFIQLSNQEGMQKAETIQIQLPNCIMSFNVKDLKEKKTEEQKFQLQSSRDSPANNHQLQPSTVVPAETNQLQDKTRSYRRKSENEERICPHCQKDCSHMVNPKSFAVHVSRCGRNKIPCKFCKNPFKAEVIKKHQNKHCSKNPNSEKKQKIEEPVFVDITGPEKEI